jgi:dihydrofolate synthase/folylpolyglutamate synthase
MRFQTLEQWLAWQEALHPNPIDMGLERVQAVFERMYRQRPPAVVITVAGTNGKGSTVAMLATILQAAGFRVGSYTSPHVLRYNERIQVEGQQASDDQICEAFARVDAARGEQSLTYFEFGTLAALSIFYESGVEVMVLEVGMGGRLDAVNILDADVAVITAIDIDHREWLGDDREQIALEKAGILRAHHPGVIVDQDIPSSLLAYAREHEVPLYCLERDFDYRLQNGQWQWLGEDGARYALPRPAMSGEFQVQNAAGVLMVLQLLRERLPVSQDAVRRGLLSARLPGRYDYQPGPVATIFDVAHNPAAARALSKTLASQPHGGRTLAVLGMMRDKDHRGVLASLADQVDGWHVGPLSSPRSAAAGTLASALGSLTQAPVHCHASVAEAYRAALAEAGAGDRIVVFGSFYTVAEVQGLRV